MSSNVQRLQLTPASSKLAESDVTAARLAGILAAAVIDTELVSSGDLHATEGLPHPVWVCFDDHKLLSFQTEMDFPETLAHGVTLDAINDLNGSCMLVQFYWEEPSLRGFYNMCYDGGLDPRQFVKMLRHFTMAFVAGFIELKSGIEYGGRACEARL